MMVVDNKFDIGQCVYLVTDPIQDERMVVAFTVRLGGIFYEVALGEMSTYHQDIEMSTERNETKALKENGNL